MTKTQIKQIFKDAGVQLGAGAMDQITYELKCYVNRMAKRCDEANLTRLTPELFYILLPYYLL